MSSAQPAPRPWTYADLVALPDDQLRHELIDGEHVVTPSPNTVHQTISLNLVRLLLPYLDEHRLGQLLSAPFDIKLSLFTVLVPDLVFFTAERFARVVNAKHAIAAPDLVVEILSPGTRRRDKGRKRAVYGREGVGEYWIVDPESRSITALRRPRAGSGLADVTTLTLDAGATLDSPLFPGLRIPLRDVFRGR
jgi:Uma2 family endonuclease